MKTGNIAFVVDEMLLRNSGAYFGTALIVVRYISYIKGCPAFTKQLETKPPDL